MKILYEPETFSIQDFGGVSRYFAGLIAYAGPGLRCELPVVLSNNLYLPRPPGGQPRWFLPGLAVPGAWRVMQYANRRAARQALRRQDFDVFHPTVNDQDYFLDPDLLGTKPFVMTIHDMIPALFGEYYAGPGTALSRLASRAARIITVSENTRADVLRLLPVSPERVAVVYHGHTTRGTRPPATPAPPLPLPDDYLLFIGNRRAYKNFGCLVRAFGLLQHEAPNLHLVCAGGGAFDARERELLRQAGVAHRTHQFGYLTDGQLDGLYRAARAFVFPSEYEGFGFPILEAFGQQCPVVLSRASCFPEIAREAALYFDPHDADELRTQLARVLRDQALRGQLRHQGLVRLRDFTWGQTVAGTRRVYEEAREDALVTTI